MKIKDVLFTGTVMGLVILVTISFGLVACQGETEHHQNEQGQSSNAQSEALTLIQKTPSEKEALAFKLPRISVDKLKDHVKILSSNEFEGRGPSTPGEKKTIEYLASQFKAMGLKPGNGDSYFQPVPVVSRCCF